MDRFARDELQAAVEMSSMCMGVFDEPKGRIHSLNKALREEVNRTEFSLTLTSRTEDRMFGRLVEGDIPVSLRVLSGRSPACLVEVYLARSKECSLRSDVVELVEMTSDGVWEWYPSLHYEFMSKRFWSIFGYDYREMPSSPDAWRSIIDPDDLVKAKVCYEAHVASKGASPYNLNVSYSHKKGHTVKVKCRGAVVEWLPDGTPWRILGTHTDITEITEAVEAKARFVSRMSHEIRTPISAILHECELLGKHPETAVIADACAQLLSLCNDILTLEKLCRPKTMKLSRQSISTGEFLHKAVRRHFRQAQKKGVTLSGKVHTPAPPHPLMLDVSKCNQVVDNLIGNAIKYTEAGGSITVELSCRPRLLAAASGESNGGRAEGCGGEEGDAGVGSSKAPTGADEEEWEVELVVSDSGVGIHPDDRDVMFDRFRQADSSMQGAGLGLSISRDLASFMSGDVALRHSELGKGSTFVFSFKALLASEAVSVGTSAPGEVISVAEALEAMETVLGRASSASSSGDVGEEPKREARGWSSSGCHCIDGERSAASESIIRILSVDDMVTNRKIIRRRLLTIQKELGAGVIEVVDAVNGRDAVRLFRDLGGFDLVFMDCLMPEMNGFEATKAIHRLCDERNIARVPVIAITASVSTVLQQECAKAGMCQVVTKPFDTLDIMTAFTSTIDPKGKGDVSPPSPRPPTSPLWVPDQPPPCRQSPSESEEKQGPR